MTAPPGPPTASDIAAHKARQRNNLIGLAVIAIVLAIGAWLMDRLLTGRTLQNCIEANHRNCAPLDLPERVR
jgi:hypothetical protein